MKDRIVEGYFPKEPRIMFFPSRELKQMRGHQMRMDAIMNVPGVVNGTVKFTVEGGTEVVDFDNRDRFGRPTRRFVPTTSDLL